MRVILLASLLAVAASSVALFLYNRKHRASAPGPVVLQYQWVKREDSSLTYVVGTVTNPAASAWLAVKVTFQLLDRNGRKISEASDYLPILEGHKAWNFKVLVPDPEAATADLAGIHAEKE